MTNPMPATKAEVGKPTKLSREMERKLKRMRKDEPGASDVHVDAPLGSARKPRKRRKPRSKVRVIRKAELDDSRMREVIAAQLDLLVEPALPVLTHALETQNPDLVLSAMGMQMWQMRFASAVEEALLAEVGRAGFEHYDVMAKAAPKLRFRFDVKDMAVRRWARKRSSDLVVEVSRNVRENIRAAVTRIYRLGVGPREGAKFVRAALGKRSALFERWALAVENYQGKLLAEGMDAAKAAELAGKYRDRLVSARARMIARTETLAAQNEGRMMAWRQAVEDGVLDLALVAKRWDATWEGVCPECDALDGTDVGLFESFPGGYDRPPAHPNCRCVVQLVRV